MGAAMAKPTVRCLIDESSRESQTRFDPQRPRVACNNPSIVVRDVTDPARICPTSSTARRTSMGSPAQRGQRRRRFHFGHE